MTSPFSDEQLSAVVDGLADPELVQRVQASPDASARLEQLRAVSELVGTSPAPATAERRASSIAAALAAAEAVAPEGVSSLAVAREKAVERKRFTDRFSPQVMAAAAAILLVALITPFLISNSGSDTTASDTATGEISTSLSDAGGADGSDDATDSADDSDRSFDGDDSAADSIDSGSDASAAMEAAPTDEAMEEDAVENDSTADTSADDEARIFFSNSPLGLLAAIEQGGILPNLFVSDPEIQSTVNPECLVDLTDAAEPGLALAEIDNDGVRQVVVITFEEDGTNTLFDAGDCSPVG
ncbi:MAG: hypothetical protein EX269_04530 [Acidimicrobiales bacterium]|nr:MAG: hypothetical protein EX269_04530 [Acidimicrobiales bacterium]